MSGHTEKPTRFWVPNGLRLRRGSRLEATLIRVAWSSEPVQALADRNRIRIKKAPVFIFLMAFASFLAVCTMLIAVNLGAPVNSAVFILSSSILGIEAIVISIDNARSRVVVLLAYLMDSLRACDLALDDPSSDKLRVALAQHIDKSATLFYRAFRKYPGGTQVKKFARQRRDLALECSRIVASYLHEASGQTSDLERIRDDFARIILRVDSGNWQQVGDLERPTDERPSLRLAVGSNRFPLVLALLSLATGIVGLVKAFYS